MDSGEAFDLAKAAGVTVRPIPAGLNTYSTPFITVGKRAAVLVQQVGFGIRAGERADAVNGLTALVADTPDLSAGRAALATVLRGTPDGEKIEIKTVAEKPIAGDI